MIKWLFGALVATAVVATFSLAEWVATSRARIEHLEEGAITLRQAVAALDAVTDRVPTLELRIVSLAEKNDELRGALGRHVAQKRHTP